MDDKPTYPGTVEGALDPREHNHWIGHQDARSTLRQSFATHRVPQAWLIEGPEGIGKATIAWNIARQLAEYGELSDTPLPKEIMDRYARGSQSSIYDICLPPDEKGGFKTQINIETMRGLNEKLALASTENTWRIVVIDPAEAMNTSAANALLKILEEPPARVLFFLVSHAPHKLLPTIHSRCQKLRLQELSVDEMQTIWPLVSEMPSPDPARFELSEGSIRMALTLDDDMSAIYFAMVNMIKPPISRAQISANAKALKGINRAETISRAKLLFQLLFGRLARAASGVGQSAPQEQSASAHIQGNLADWAVLSQSTLIALDDAARLNLDPEVTITTSWLAIDEFLRAS